jgi:hypothetical protein
MTIAKLLASFFFSKALVLCRIPKYLKNPARSRTVGEIEKYFAVRRGASMEELGREYHLAHTLRM